MVIRLDAVCRNSQNSWVMFRICLQEFEKFMTYLFRVHVSLNSGLKRKLDGNASIKYFQSVWELIANQVVWEFVANIMVCANAYAILCCNSSCKNLGFLSMIRPSGNNSFFWLRKVHLWNYVFLTQHLSSQILYEYDFFEEISEGIKIFKHPRHCVFSATTWTDRHIGHVGQNKKKVDRLSQCPCTL